MDVGVYDIKGRKAINFTFYLSNTDFQQRVINAYVVQQNNKPNPDPSESYQMYSSST